MSGPSYRFQYSSLGPWTAIWNAAINPTEPTFYASQTNADGSVTLTVSGPAVAGSTGCGALLKGIQSVWPEVPFSHLANNVSLIVDDSPAWEFIEIDVRLTDPKTGITYPCDMHVARDGTIGVGSIAGGWTPTAVKIPPFAPWTLRAISALWSLDWANDLTTLVSVQSDAQVFAVNATVAAGNIGWTDAIVNQLQIDQAPTGGTCMATFSKLSMSGS